MKTYEDVIKMVAEDYRSMKADQDQKAIKLYYNTIGEKISLVAFIYGRHEREVRKDIFVASRS